MQFFITPNNMLKPSCHMRVPTKFWSSLSIEVRQILYLTIF